MNSHLFCIDICLRCLDICIWHLISSCYKYTLSLCYHLFTSCYTCLQVVTSSCTNTFGSDVSTRSMTYHHVLKSRSEMTWRSTKRSTKTGLKNISHTTVVAFLYLFIYLSIYVYVLSWYIWVTVSRAAYSLVALNLKL